MDDHTFELEGQVFGLHQTIAVEQQGFQPGSASADDDTTTWVFEGFLDSTDEPSALAALAALRRLWVRRREATDRPALRYALGGRTRRIYGKPTRWDQAVDNRLLGGGGGVSMEFKTADHLHYDDDEHVYVLRSAPASLGGFLVPFTLPWTSQSNGVVERSLVLGGDAPAPFSVAFTGPLTNGYVAGREWRIEVAAALGDGDTLTVDTRPWSYGVSRNGGPGAGLLAGTTTGLSRCRLDPNGEMLTFGGISSSGTATATIRWRPAWFSL